jgi:hypothetical protein
VIGLRPWALLLNLCLKITSPRQCHSDKMGSIFFVKLAEEVKVGFL